MHQQVIRRQGEGDIKDKKEYSSWSHQPECWATFPLNPPLPSPLPFGNSSEVLKNASIKEEIRCCSFWGKKVQQNFQKLSISDRGEIELKSMIALCSKYQVKYFVKTSQQCESTLWFFVCKKAYLPPPICHSPLSNTAILCKKFASWKHQCFYSSDIPWSLVTY